MLWIPSMVPISLGVIYKRTPGWSGWSTVLIGMVAGAIAKMSFSSELMLKFFGEGVPLNQFERNDSEYIYISIVVLTVTIAWFFFTSFFYISPGIFFWVCRVFSFFYFLNYKLIFLVFMIKHLVYQNYDSIFIVSSTASWIIFCVVFSSVARNGTIEFV